MGFGLSQLGSILEVLLFSLFPVIPGQCRCLTTTFLLSYIYLKLFATVVCYFSSDFLFSVQGGRSSVDLGKKIPPQDEANLFGFYGPCRAEGRSMSI